MSAHFLHINCTDCFEREGFALDLNNGLRTLSTPFPLPLSALHKDAYRACKSCVTNASSEEEPRNFLIYWSKCVIKSQTEQFCDSFY